jgi:acetate kinase
MRRFKPNSPNFRHNASALAIIKTCLKELPEAKNIAFFDSSFHYTLPAAVRNYAIDQKMAEEKGLRKYGFHGISYEYILHKVAGYLNKSQSSTNLIVMHLGSGASICAIRDGKSIDTS